MKISNLKLNNVRSFPSLDLSFSDSLNLFVGKNNSGKTTIIKSLSLLQCPYELKKEDLRSSKEDGQIKIRVIDKEYFATKDIEEDTFVRKLTSQSGAFIKSAFVEFEDKEPKNKLFYFSSFRKTKQMQEQVNSENVSRLGDFTYLPSKLAQIGNPGHSAFKKYEEFCLKVFGKIITNHPTNNGMTPGVYANNSSILITSMGDGVLMLVGMLTTILTSENKIFLIEEPETDLHPEALKIFLDLILEASKNNQFFITTHSNVVLRHLGISKKNYIFELKSNLENELWSSTCEKLETEESKIGALENLGYDFFDDYSYSGWIFFEEASAESYFREILLPLLLPNLCFKIKTYSCKGVDNVEKRFSAFNELFSFINLDKKYMNRAWAIIDDGPNEKKVHTRLLETYYEKGGWLKNNFKMLNEHDFENYLPKKYKDHVVKIKKGKLSKGDLIAKVIEDYHNGQLTSKQIKDAAPELVDIVNEIGTYLQKHDKKTSKNVTLFTK